MAAGVIVVVLRWAISGSAPRPRVRHLHAVGQVAGVKTLCSGFWRETIAGARAARRSCSAKPRLITDLITAKLKAQPIGLGVGCRCVGLEIALYVAHDLFDRLGG